MKKNHSQNFACEKFQLNDIVRLGIPKTETLSVQRKLRQLRNHGKIIMAVHKN